MILIEDTCIIIVTYNHEEFIGECLKSIISENFPEVIVVDNNSTDNTINIVESFYPKVKIIKNSINIGFGAANNSALKYSKKKYLIFLNPDTMIEKGTITHLLTPIEKDEFIVTTPKVLTYNGEKINTCGNMQHITGMAFTRGMGEVPENRKDYLYVNGISGACFAITRKNFIDLGCFDETLFLYMEDTEFSWRISSKDQKILYVPETIVYHDYDFMVSPEKIYHVEVGRYIILRKYLLFKYYLLLSPSLFMTEMLTWGYAILNGPMGIKCKIKAIYKGLTVDVTKQNTDTKSLLRLMDVKIPKLKFKFNLFFMIFRNIANFIYIKNRRLI